VYTLAGTYNNQRIKYKRREKDFLEGSREREHGFLCASIPSTD
jgi:hypothetical protein